MPSRRAMLRAAASSVVATSVAGCAGLDGGPAAADWRASVAGCSALSTPAPSTGVVATSGRIDGGDDGRVDAFDPDTGERLWRSGVAEPTGLAADGDRVYAGRRWPGRVLAFDATSGDREWTADVGNLGSAIATAGQTVYVANGSLAAVDAATGTVRWEQAAVQGTNFTVTAGPTDQLAATDEGALFADGAGVVALAPDDGGVRWRWRPDGWETTTAGPYVYDRVFVGGGERGRVVALDRDGGEVLWERSLDGAASVVGFHVQNRTLVVATRTAATADAGAGTVHVLDRTGDTVERAVSVDAPPTATASAGDRFVLALADGTVVGLDVGWADPERWRASLSTDDAMVATDGDAGYAVDGDGTLWALAEP